MQPDLFSGEPYPHSPGFRKTDTSRAAAEHVKPSAPHLQQIVLSFLRSRGPATTREIAAGVNVDYASIQPRTSELSKLNKIADSGLRRKEGKVSVIVWRAV